MFLKNLFAMVYRSRTLLAVTGAILLNVGAYASSKPDQSKLIGILQSDAALHEKARACQQLGEIGNKEAVPALASLLGDVHLSAYARAGLEGISGPSASAALRAAATNLTGDQRIGVINSLAVVRDAKSVPLLSSLAASPEVGVAGAALLALGRIANGKAIQRLLQVVVSGPDALRPDAGVACLIAAETELARGRAASAARLYEAVRNANVPDSCRAAAVRGAILACKPAGRPALLMEQLRSQDRLIRNLALMSIPEVSSSALADALNAELKKASPELAVQLLVALVDCHNAKSIPVLKGEVDADAAEVRKTALVVLSQIGDPTDATVFLEAFRKNRSSEETALAMRYLTSAEGSEVDRQIGQALATESDAANRVRLTHLMARRGLTNSAPELLAPADSLATTLFDGHSLAGWEGNTNVWRVRDGVIVGGFMAGNPQNEFLATVARYTNFDLRLEYKLVGTTGFVNSGVQFASERTMQPPNEMTGFQADIGAGFSGYLYDESRRNRHLVKPPAELIKKIEKLADWNDYEIRCSGPHIQIWLNGTRTVDYTEADPAIPLSGLIALQIHGGCQAEVSFRNIVLRKL